MIIEVYLGCLLTICMFTCISDIRHRKISNKLLVTYSLLQSLGIFFDNFYVGSLSIVFILGLLVFAAGICGAGDVKFITIMSLSLPIHVLPVAFALTALFGGILAIVLTLLAFLTRHRPNPINYRELPYGVAISLGFYITIYDHLMPTLAS